MHKSDVTTSYEDYIQIIRGKTAELFAACCMVGAVISSASKKQKDSMLKFGRYLGIAFQIADDAIDYNSNSKKMGKKNGDDFREGKATLPVIYAYEKANKSEREYLEDIFSKPEKYRNKKAFEQTLKIIKKYNSIENTILKSKYYANLARKELNNFEDSDYKKAMLEILDFCVERNF
jgi:octaprenyl-diphosphate synthase